MSRSKREEQLKENERYPLRSLNSNERALFEHEEELARKRQADRERKREEKK